MALMQIAQEPEPNCASTPLPNPWPTAAISVEMPVNRQIRDRRLAASSSPPA